MADPKNTRGKNGKTPDAKPPQPPVNAGSGENPPADSKDTAKTVKALSVQSSQQGFRRAGRAWSKEATVMPLAELTEEQIEQIKNEPMLTVDEVEIPATEVSE